jgi:SP family arabinose:H+ symporter-like MFS transporter
MNKWLDTAALDNANRDWWRLGWICLVASIGGTLFGFDTAVVSGTIKQVTTQYKLTALAEGYFTSSALFGCITGAAVAGFFADRFGRKSGLVLAAILFFLSGLCSTIPPTFEMLVSARMACGVGIGMTSVIAPMYISEFSPARWRGRLGGLYQLFIVVGVLLAYLSNWYTLRFAQGHPAAFGENRMLHWLFVSEYWRGMFAIEIVPAGLFLFLLFYVPESPRWLIKVGQEARGLRILARVNDREIAENAFKQIDKGFEPERSSIRELFRPGLRRALLVGVMLSVFGQLSGVNVVVYYGPKILLAAGYHDAGALLGQVGFGLINLAFTLFALSVIDRWGRRPLLLGGMAAVSLTMTVTGILFFGGHVHIGGLGAAVNSVMVSKSTGLWIGLMICIYIGCIALSICAVIWVVTPEIFPTRVRGTAVSIATFANWSTNAFSALFFPAFVASFGMYSFFFVTAGICLLATMFFWKYLPETAGRSFEEIENLWLNQRVRISVSVP